MAVGADLSVNRILSAYNQGIFPWYNPGEPILWWSPDPRMVLPPQNIKVSKSMRKVLRDTTWQLTYNTAFLEVILACKHITRTGQDGTWITNEMVEAYQKLHEQGIAESVEVWQGKELVGGLYGLNLKDKRIFCGESMFTRVSNASKYAFINLAKRLTEQQYRLIDCQVYNDHLASMGATEMPREEFLGYL